MPSDPHPALVPVTPDRHGNRFWQRFSRYDFAAHSPRLPIVLAELAEAASVFPIALQITPQPGAVALLELTGAGPVPFVDPESGAWRAPYAPAALRAHPFDAREDATGEMTLLVDEDSGLLSGVPTDTPIYTPDGRFAPATEQVMIFLQRRLISARATVDAVRALQEADVLVPLTPRGHLTETRCAGLYTPDPARLAGLGDAQILFLFRTGALSLAEAARISLQHCGRQLRMAQAQDGGAASDTAPAPAASAVTGFLDALADAQDAETALAFGTDDSAEETSP